uniref:Uncharacterized protein n=1 Tax=viral metagenome TaxID=1070528 RepID=A0A6M3IVL8_9ZZZZ
MIKPMGTLICQRCGSTQSGKLDLVCDECNLPNWDIVELQRGIELLNKKKTESPPPPPPPPKRIIAEDFKLGIKILKLKDT